NSEPRGAARPSGQVENMQVSRPARDAHVPATDDVRDLMWRHVGLLRSRVGLEDAVAVLGTWWQAARVCAPSATADRDFRLVASLVTVGLLIARSALRREESRGGHFRTDIPQHDDLHWKKHVGDQMAPGSRPQASEL